jgi:hypothetical protein
MNKILIGDKRLPARKFKDYPVCPQCGLHSEHLVWINFTSPKWTWKEHVGREGPLSICPVCNIQVDFIPEMIN